MLKDEIEKKTNKRNYPNQPRLTCQTCDLSHEIRITLQKANKKFMKSNF